LIYFLSQTSNLNIGISLVEVFPPENTILLLTFLVFFGGIPTKTVVDLHISLASKRQWRFSPTSKELRIFYSKITHTTDCRPLTLQSKDISAFDGDLSSFFSLARLSLNRFFCSSSVDVLYIYTFHSVGPKTGTLGNILSKPTPIMRPIVQTACLWSADWRWIKITG